MTDGLFAGRYQLAELLGAGGMARVHRAQDTRMGRTVAVKTLLPDLADNPDARRRFAREAQAAGSLNHPGIVTVHDQDEIREGDEVVPYLVMEFVPGGTLSQLLRRRVFFPPERAVRVVCDILDALAHAHSHGTVHRDVKPANVMVTPEGVVKVADFGIARVLDTDSRLTTTGSAIGTPSYMSPEQINGAEVDARSDVYAVGCMLTELLTGKPPFTDGNPINLMYWHVHTAPPAPSSRNPRVPPELDALVLAALAKNPADRHGDARVFRDRLRGWLVSSGNAGLLAGPAIPASFDTATTPLSAAKPPYGPADDAADAANSGAASGGSGAPPPSTPPPSTPPPSTPPPATGGFGFAPVPGPSTPPPPTPAEHPAYAPRPQVPLPPPYLPSTPPPFNRPGNSGEFDPARRARRRWTTAVAAVAVAAVGVTVTLLYGPLGGKHHDKADPTPTPSTHGPTVTAQPANLARHGGKAGTGYNGGLDGVVNASDRKGGTLRLAAAYPEDGMLDPAIVYTQPSWNLQRLFERKLVDYAPDPGPAGRKLLPDLAKDTGTVSNGGKTWTFHLKAGLRYEDGSAITSQDIKYGIERTFDRDVFIAGPANFVELLDEGQHYPGPYKDTDPDRLGLKSVATPDDTTIVFTLAQPFADFPYVLAMPMGAPVPRKVDTGNGTGYRDQPLSSGPYKIESYQRDKSVHMVRNTEWDQSTDPVRSALPDEIDLTIYSAQDAVENALLSGDADIDLQSQALSDGTRARVTGDDALHAQTDLAYDSSTRYISLQTAVAPFDKQPCRAAVQYAVDRVSVRTALGGANAGDIATTMLPPTVDGFDPDAHPYGDSTGKNDTTKAREQLAVCGKPSGFSTTLVGAANNPTTLAAMMAVQQSLKNAGIAVNVKQVPLADLYSALDSPTKVKQNGWGMVMSAWAADWPNGGGFLRTLVAPGSPTNYAGVNDPGLDLVMSRGESADAPEKSTAAWREADEKIMADAALVPLVHGRHLVFRSSRLTNVYEHEVFGAPDLTALGLAN
ncbi:ABC transporter substrate-binding protein [Streptomyces sp. NPDC021020]|uniref:ABC transporter substrate-binding protein n=1 Tax=Streptomyces sp. NPDC021020 TaxID=3365109 RepID=UPI0037B305DE